jgi:hypothetical protein
MNFFKYQMECVKKMKKEGTMTKSLADSCLREMRATNMRLSKNIAKRERKGT